MQKILYAVSTTSTANDIPLFIVDPTVLRNSLNYSHDTSDSYCKVLCTNRKVTHLATINEYATQLRLSKFARDLRDRGYTVFELTDVDPNYVHNDMHVSLSLHMIVLDEKVDKVDGHVVHIVVFHDKLGKFWWSGGLNLNEHQMRLLHRQGVRRFDFLLMTHDSIYDK